MLSHSSYVEGPVPRTSDVSVNGDGALEELMKLHWGREGGRTLGHSCTEDRHMRMQREGWRPWQKPALTTG